MKNHPRARAHPETPQALPSVSVCCPAYNEEANVARVLLGAHALLSGSHLDYEIIVCDDGSADQTGDIVDRIGARYPDIRVLHHAKNRGMRETFEHLYHEATKEFVFLNPADGQWDTSILLELLPETRRFDIVIAARRDKHYGILRAFVSGAFNLIPWMLFGVRTHDAGAVKLVRREIIERFPLVSHSPFSEAERLVRASRAGYRITDHPVETHLRRQGQSHGVSAALVLESLRDVVRVWLALRDESRRAGK
jgi:glycosyltransferase involved in cell wall biosynthesis